MLIVFMRLFFVLFGIVKFVNVVATNVVVGFASGVRFFGLFMRVFVMFVVVSVLLFEIFMDLLFYVFFMYVNIVFYCLIAKGFVSNARVVNVLFIFFVCMFLYIVSVFLCFDLMILVNKLFLYLELLIMCVCLMKFAMRASARFWSSSSIIVCGFVCCMIC